MALPSAVVQEGVNRVFSWLDDKALTADTVARIEIALSRIDFVLEKTGKVAITYLSLIRTWQVLKRVHMEGMDLLNKYRPQELEEVGQAVVTSSSYLQRIANRTANLSISSLVGFAKARLSPCVAKKFERYADLAEKFVTQVESGSPLKCKTFRYPFLRYLFEGKTLGCEIMGKKPSQSLSCCLHPVIVQGRGVEAIVSYCYEDRRTLGKYFRQCIKLRISEDTDIIGITIKCMQWWAALFKLAVEPAIGELTQLPNVQDIFQSFVSPPSNMKDDKHVFDSTFCRPEPICCNGNSIGTLANKSSIEIPEPVILIEFWCYISGPKNSWRNAPVLLKGSVAPHLPCDMNGKICIMYGGNAKIRNGSVQQLEEIARSDGLDYLVHQPVPTDYLVHEPVPTATGGGVYIISLSPHGYAAVSLRRAMPSPGRRVPKRKR